MHQPAPSLVSSPHHGELDGRWFKRPDRHRPAGRIRLLCFHHAGGSAAAFRTWPAAMTTTVEPVAVQLPGRADRFTEPAFDRFTPLLDELVDVITPVLDRPYAFYGVSMGARLAWTLAVTLRERGLALPVQLFLAGEPAPEHDDGSRPWEDCPGGLEGYLRSLGGTSQEVLAEPALMRLVLSTLQADLTALTTAPAPHATPLDIPIHAFAGTTDDVAPPPRMAGWQRETTGRFSLDAISGGHFFDTTGEQQVIRAISDDLTHRPEGELR